MVILQTVPANLVGLADDCLAIRVRLDAVYVTPEVKRSRLLADMMLL